MRQVRAKVLANPLQGWVIELDLAFPPQALA